jgi:tetratricopeptide (TPR) repeat protein
MTKTSLLSGKYFPSILLLFLCWQITSLAGPERKFNKDWSYYSEEEVTSFSQLQEFKDKSKDVFALRQAKRALINGDLNLAKFFLAKVDTKNSKLGIVKDRYLATLYFIEGKYQESYEILSSKRFSPTAAYREVCLLRIVNLMAIDNLKLFQNEVANCRSVTFTESINKQFWLSQVKNIKERNVELLKGNLIVQLRNALADKDYTKAWMKLALFLNREDVIIRYIANLPSSAYNSKGVRELIGFAYYRLGKTEKALEFIEDIESPNADNIRGTANLLKKKYELAFGHFKLALQKKGNSANALERGIPLAYTLGLWDEGINMLRRVVDTGLDERKKIALEAAFNIRKEDFKRSRALLNILEELFKRKVPVEVNLMDSYVALREGDNDRLKIMSGDACKRGNGLSCYLNLQTIHWENIGQTMRRDEPTVELANFDIQDLKAPKSISPLKESVIIDQKDIEELDSNEFQLKVSP